MKNKIILMLSLVCYINQNIAMKNDEHPVTNALIKKTIEGFKNNTVVQILHENKIDRLTFGLLCTLLGAYLIKVGFVNMIPYKDDGIGSATIAMFGMFTTSTGIYNLYNLYQTNPALVSLPIGILCLILMNYLKNKTVDADSNVPQELHLD